MPCRSNFESVLSIEHAGMVNMFKTLEELGPKGFLGVECLVFEGAVIEFFENAKVIAGKIVSFVANRKMVITKDVFATMFQLPTEELVGFTDLPIKEVSEMKMRFSGTDVAFRPPNKKKEMKVEYRLLHEIVEKALCAKDGFRCGTSEKFDLMVAISAGLKAHGEEQPAPEAEETTRIEQQAQEQIEEISQVVETVEETEAEAEAVNSQEHHAQKEEHWAQEEERSTQEDEQQAHEEPVQQAEQADERQAQAGSSPSSP
ncbi:hypothetical protein F511_33583 [Dorcoceras hygrometricum]|uniref:Uncharacterized protein n=1 Tax=Dorcoceras hygrometricum TaxID=472368 RepID=A0A2Z7BFM1_9LAMI|nr:hypothetical protein F511_33583 [Dorcoceras hygrometricum]